MMPQRDPPPALNCLVLGGCGFIGSHIVDALLAAGHRVRILDHQPERLRPSLPSVEYRCGDFTDSDVLQDALGDIDVVLHSLSTTIPATSNADPESDVQSNLVGTLRLLEAMCGAGIRRIVFLSSGGTVYGRPQRLPVDEHHPVHPLCSYGVVKLAIEHYLFMYQELYGLRSVAIRAANPYGPRQGKIGAQGAIATFAHRMIHNEPIEIWGDGSTVRDFFHVTDLARLCVMAAESQQCGVFNAGGGHGHSLNDILKLLTEISGKRPEIHYREARGFDVHDIVLDIGLARHTFGWEPRITLRDGLADYIATLSAGEGE